MAYQVRGVAGENYNQLSDTEKAGVQSTYDNEYNKYMSNWGPNPNAQYISSGQNQAGDAAQRYAESIFTQRSNATAQRQPLFAQAVNDYNKTNPNGDYSQDFLNQWKDVAGNSLNDLTLVNGVPTSKASIQQEQANRAGVLSGQLKAVQAGNGTAYIPTGSSADANQVNIGTNNTSNTANANVPPVANQLGAVSQPNTPNTSQGTQGFSLTGGNLQQGIKGDNVKQLQTLLGITADGDFGPLTKQAVIAFQQKNGLTPDGIVGPQTQAKLAQMGGGNTQMTNTNNPAIGNQLGAVSSTTQPSAGTNTGATGTDLAGQYSALLGNTTGIDSAQKAIDDQNNAARTGIQNIGEQPIGMQFISGQQKSIEDRNTNLQIPLAQRLALEQQKRQASLDSIKFQLDNKYRNDVLNKKDTTLPTSVEEYNFAKSQGYTGTFSQYQTEDANRKASVAKAGATSVNNILPSSQNLTTRETSDALMSVNQINNVLDNPDFDSAFGPKGIINRNIPGSAAQTVVALTTQILDKAAVAARGQLKGQGQVSNFEVQMLKNAQSALSSYTIAPAAARQALIDMQGAINTSTGGTAKVTLLDKKSGQTDSRYLTSREITKAIADGLQVKYIK